MLHTGVDQPDAVTADDPPPATLRPIEIEVIDLFVGLSRALGQPRSIGEIFGLLFISHAPLAMDHVMTRLKLSRGSASQGLKFLRNLGAIHPVYVPGDRRVHYHAEGGLRTLAGNFIRDRLEPHLGNGADRLNRLAVLLKDLPPDQRNHARQRVNMLRSWSNNARRLLPVVLKLLGS